MSLPMPPRKLPMPPARPGSALMERIDVEKQGCDRALLRIDCNLYALTRTEVFRLIGKLERVGATL